MEYLKVMKNIECERQIEFIVRYLNYEFKYRTLLLLISNGIGGILSFYLQLDKRLHLHVKSTNFCWRKQQI